MDVYFENQTCGEDSASKKLTPHLIQKSFLWEDQEIQIPAVYLGETGIALDICAKISFEDMAAFLKKWNKALRLAMNDPQEYEQLAAENPGNAEILVKMSFDNSPLMRSMSSSMRWYPKRLFQLTEPDLDEAWGNDPQAEAWILEYGLDKECCWYLERAHYRWKDAPNLSPSRLSLVFQSGLRPITVGHFQTEAESCEIQVDADGENRKNKSILKTIKTIHPKTGQEYTLTLHKCEQARHSFQEPEQEDPELNEVALNEIKGAIYPEYCQILYYSVTPQIGREFFDICDCKAGEPVKNTGSDTRKTCVSAVIFAVKSPYPNLNAAVSSMHFSPVKNVEWRIVFNVKEKEDFNVQFPLNPFS